MYWSQQRKDNESWHHELRRAVDAEAATKKKGTDVWYVKAFISGKWREYTCQNIADVEALQQVFALAYIEYKPATDTPDSTS